MAEWTHLKSLLQSKKKMQNKSKEREWTNLALWLYASALPAARRTSGAPCCPCTALGEGTAGPKTWNRRGLNSRGSVSTRPGTSASAASGRADGSTPGWISLAATGRMLKWEWKQREFKSAHWQAEAKDAESNIEAEIEEIKGTHLMRLSWICRDCRGRRHQSCRRCIRRSRPGWPGDRCTAAEASSGLCCTRPPRWGSRCSCARAVSPPAGSCSWSTSPLGLQGLLGASHTAPRPGRQLSSKRPPWEAALDLPGASAPVCSTGWTRNQSTARWGLEISHLSIVRH